MLHLTDEKMAVLTSLAEPIAFGETVKSTGVLRRLEQRRCRFEHPSHPRSMGLFRRLVREALPKIAVENGGPNLAEDGRLALTIASAAF